MARLSVAPYQKNDAKFATFLDEYERRVEATPPGMCAVAMQLDLLRAGGCQTCGKCVPCREGIAHIETLLEEVLAFDAGPDVLEGIRAQATVVRDTADCAIGWHAAKCSLRASMRSRKSSKATSSRGNAAKVSRRRCRAKRCARHT